MSNVNDVRKRRQDPKNEENNSSLRPDNEPLDVDDQEKIIQQIHDEFVRQQQFIEFMFTTICRIAALISLLVTIIIQYRKSITVSTNNNDITSDNDNLSVVLRWTHATLAVVIDLFIPLVTLKWKKNGKYLTIGSASIALSSWYCIYLPMLVTLPVASIAVWIARKGNDEESKYFHYCIIISNVLLIGSALVLQMDENQFVTSIHDLKASKYQYKEL